MAYVVEPLDSRWKFLDLKECAGRYGKGNGVLHGMEKVNG
jgi:hypothetical protein